MMALLIGCNRSPKVDPGLVTEEQEKEMKAAKAVVDQAESAKMAKEKSGGRASSSYVNPEEAAFRSGGKQ